MFSRHFIARQAPVGKVARGSSRPFHLAVQNVSSTLSTPSLSSSPDKSVIRCYSSSPSRRITFTSCARPILYERLSPLVALYPCPTFFSPLHRFSTGGVYIGAILLGVRHAYSFTHPLSPPRLVVSSSSPIFRSPFSSSSPPSSLVSKETTETLTLEAATALSTISSKYRDTLKSELSDSILSSHLQTLSEQLYVYAASIPEDCPEHKVSKKRLVRYAHFTELYADVFAEDAYRTTTAQEDLNNLCSQYVHCYATCLPRVQTLSEKLSKQHAQLHSETTTILHPAQVNDFTSAVSVSSTLPPSSQSSGRGWGFFLKKLGRMLVFLLCGIGWFMLMLSIRRR